MAHRRWTTRWRQASPSGSGTHRWRYGPCSAYSGPRALIADNALSTESLERLPRDLEDALSQYWDELPPPVQGVLRVASVAGRRFPSDPVISACGATVNDDAADLLARAADTYSYVRPLKRDLYGFDDASFYQTARRSADETFTAARVAAIHQAVVDYAVAPPESGSQAAREAAMSIHVALATEGLTDQLPAGESAWTLAELAADRFDFGTAVAYGRHYLQWTGIPFGDYESLPGSYLHRRMAPE